jgi:hypothetical protein
MEVMMRSRFVPFALGPALLFAAGVAGAVVSGAAAPGFTITDTAGKAVQLADYKGKYVVLEWTKPRVSVRAQALFQRQYAGAAKGMGQP